MKTVFSFILCTVILLTGIQLNAADIWVSPSGSDYNPGTKEKPLATVAMALRKVREMRRLNDPAVKEAVHIIVRGGVYQLEEPLFIRPEDAGTAASPTYIEAAPNEEPVFSGGVKITGWQKATGKIAGLPAAAQGKVWVATAPKVGGHLLGFRQLWINNNKATRARDRNADSMSRILSWNHREQTCWIPKPRTADLSKVEGMEMLIHQWWAIAILRIKRIDVEGDSAKLTFHQPESRVQSEHPWPAPWISKKTGNSAFYLSNAIQFLDEPGEWYLDEDNRKVYYWPRNGENLPKSDVVAPNLETLLKIEGTIDHPVSHVYVKGISFKHTGWQRPSKEGHVPHQIGLYMLDAYKLKIPGTPDKKGLENQAWVGRPAAAVEANYTHHTGFEQCRFEHLASAGLDYKKGAYYDVIVGNLFKDIGGNGIQVGLFSDEAMEVHLPYNPSDEREICTGTQIRNNLITDVTNEDWGCVGIAAGFVRKINIEHNEISEVSYSGISMGWGWTRTINAMNNNTIAANRINHYAKHMYDVSAIYTLSAQPGSVIHSNYIDSIYKAPYVHDPNHWFYLYTDEGSSYFTVKNNWCPSEKFLRNANGPNNEWTNNGPQVADSIKKKAGIQPEYSYLLKERVVNKGNRPINYSYISGIHGKNTPVVKSAIIEVIVPNQNGEQAIKTLTEIGKSNGLDAKDMYSWNDHFIMYGNLLGEDGLMDQIKTALPGAAVKLYKDPLYHFKREKCPDPSLEGSWENIILTANLVNDPVLQQEYMQYHADQFTEWPEVSAGFCKAQFQQLQVFRNGRQLMLVISIPKGASLDELNPKTTENNPRVDEWNKIMSKYQEGIVGTKPGEVWVFFKPFDQ